MSIIFLYSKDALTIENLPSYGNTYWKTPNLDALVEKVSTKLYPQTRIKRILTANLLGITNDFTVQCLESDLYAKVLAVNSNSLDLISLMAKNSSIPVLTRKSDATVLKKTAEKCFEKDVLANDLYCLATDKKINEHQMLIV